MSKKKLIGTYPIYAVYARNYAIYANNTNYTINVKKVDTRGLEQKIFVSASDTYATVLISPVLITIVFLGT